MPSLSRLADLFAGADSSPYERRQRLYLATSASGAAIGLGIFVAMDLLAGRFVEAMLTSTFAVVLLGLVALIPVWPRPRLMARIVVAGGMILITHETSIGANEGLTFLWFFLIPTGIYFLLGRREGALWTAAVAVLLAYLLFVVDPRTTPDGSLGTLVLSTFLLSGLLGHGLETARHRLSSKVQLEKAALQKALDQVETLAELVPICASCKRARDDQGYWHQIESYLSSHTLVELSPAFCPSCTGPAEPGHTRDAEARELEPAERKATEGIPNGEPRGSDHERRRRKYFTLGMGLFIPLIAYFGSIDVRAGRMLEAGLVYGLAVVLTGLLLVLRTGRCDRTVYQAAAGAALGVFAYELHVGAYGGFAVLWVYSFPAFTIFVLGRRGVLWSAFAFLLTAFYLLLPIGHDYSPALSARLLVTLGLVSLFSYRIESARSRSYDLLLQESAALREALDQVRTLRGLLPICPSCKKVRDDDGFWELLEIHVSKASGPRFTHGICPDCAEEVLADLPSYQNA